MYHEPVLTHEVGRFLVNEPDGIYLDGTAGGGGHSADILERFPNTTVVSLDRDEDAIEAVRNRLAKFGSRSIVCKSNFSDFDQALERLKIEKVNGIFLDLGVSSHQIDTAERGFSFRQEGRLDMRMDRSQERTAYDVVNNASWQELANIFRTYGEERRSASIAKAIVMKRTRSKIETTEQLAKIIEEKTPPKHRVKSLSRVFQALRIFLNAELDNLSQTLEKSLDALQPSGRIVILSYHSLEDRVTKRFFKNEASQCECPPDIPICICNKRPRLKILTRRVVQPTLEEVRRNPRSRSARLRAAEYIGTGN